MKKINIFYFLLFSHLELSAQFGGSPGGNRPPGGIGYGNNATLTPGGPDVIMYQNLKYSGMSRALGDGAFLANNLGFLGNNVSSIYIRSLDAYGDRAASSIQVAPGYAIRVFNGVNCTGHFQTFSGSVISLSPYGWNDKIRSLEIRRL